MDKIEPQTIEQIKKLYLTGKHSDKELAAKFKLKLDQIQSITKTLPKLKYYYDVKVECMLPATLTYKVLAESPEQAATLVKNLSPNSVKHKLAGRKELKLMVYDAGSTFMKLMRNLINNV
jgi:hypothetical protein